MDDSRPPSGDELLEIAFAAAEAGAQVVARRSGKEVAFDTKSTETDLVTELDKSSEAAIIRVIEDARPLDAIVAEETGVRRDTRSPTQVRWIVDPLDGTTNFVYGYPAWAVSVCAEVDGSPAAAVVWDPVHTEVYAASRAGPATCNGEEIRIRPSRGLDRSLFCTGFAYDRDLRSAQGEVLARLVGRVGNVRRGGSAALDLCWLAAGRLDAFWEAGLRRWDFAGAALVASRAGADVTDLEGGEPSVRAVVAASPGLMPGLRALLVECGADEVAELASRLVADG
ncbi:MAG: inositol monophosphatase [Acidimicrobiales bacterium]|nr:MAG: inositol monophosphatase [Acidimicrobiales bacterium]